MLVSFERDIAKWTRHLKEDVASQVPFATSKALNMTARDDAKPAVEGRIVTAFDNPTPFTKRGVAVRNSTRYTLVSTVFIKDIQAKYLALEETGGVRKPTKRALLMPVQQRLNKYGNLPRGSIQRALARDDTFSGTIKGTAGIWKRMKSGQLKLLVRYDDQATYRPLFRFKETVKRSAIDAFPRNFATVFEQALRTAR